MKNILKSLAIITLLAPTLLFSQETCPSGEEVEKTESCGFIFDRYPPVYYSSSYHWIKAVSAYGDSIEIEDGSIWKVNSYDQYKVLNLRQVDDLGNPIPYVITQNNRWFTSYDYRIVNKATGSAVEVKLFQGPIENGEFSRYVVGPLDAYGQFDLTKNYVLLSDNSHWEICPSDLYTFRKWALKDAVIIGFNSGWQPDFEGILIDVDLNSCIRVKQF